MSIEGIPDGWEPVRFDYANDGEYFLGEDGEPLVHTGIQSQAKRLIIRKIEKPKQYRHFANPIEAQPLIGEVLRFKLDHQSMGMFIGITNGGFQIGLSHWNPKDVFDCFERLDGTPFGIEVTE